MENEQSLVQDLKEKLKKALFTTAIKQNIEGKQVFIVSDDVEDRQGEVISTEGWKLENYKKYPVLLWGHNANEPLIGHGTNLRYRDVSGKKKLTFEPKFHRKSKLSQLVSDLVEENWIRGVSVGFRPLEKDGNVYKKQELLEVSFVNVPANPNALNLAYSKGYKEETISKIMDVEKAKEIEAIEQEKLKSEKVKKITEKLAKQLKEAKEIMGDNLVEKEGPEDNDEKMETFEIVGKPYPNEHACRLFKPEAFQSGSFRRMTRKHEGKEYSVIMGKLKDEDTMTEQGYRYSKDIWSAGDAKSHCDSHNGISFEAATEKESCESCEDELETEKKAVIPYLECPMADEGMAWNAGAEVKKASGDAAKLKKMHAWIDSGADGFNADERQWYKLPHQRGDGSQAVVWRGVAAAMGALLGARGGVKIPDADRKGVYNHLAKHYEQFGKEVPEFKEYTEQELKEMFGKIPAGKPEEAGHMGDMQADIRELKNILSEMSERSKERDKILFETNKKEVEKAFKNIRLRLDAVSNGIKPDDGLEQRFDNIENNIEDLALGLQTFVLENKSSEENPKRSSDAEDRLKRIDKKTEQTRRVASVVLDKLNKTLQKIK